MPNWGIVAERFSVCCALCSHVSQGICPFHVLLRFKLALFGAGFASGLLLLHFVVSFLLYVGILFLDYTLHASHSHGYEVYGISYMHCW